MLIIPFKYKACDGTLVLQTVLRCVFYQNIFEEKINERKGYGFMHDIVYRHLVSCPHNYIAKL